MKVVGDLLRQRAWEYPSKPFWWVGDDKATYAEADARTDRVAAGLAELDVHQGDRVAVLSTNRREYLEAIFGLAKLGAIQVPLNAYLRGDFLRHQIAQAEPKVVIGDAAGIKAIVPIMDRVAAIKRIVSFDNLSNTMGEREIVPFEEVRMSKEDAPDPNINPGDLISIMYTSGTTGMPKGCMLPNGYYVNSGSQMRGVIKVRNDDVLFTALPLYHGAAQMMTVMFALCEGLSVVVEEEFHVTSILDRWIETKATLFMGVGMMGNAILQMPSSEKDRAHRVRGGFCRMTVDAQRKFRERFGIDMSAGLYGQSECVPVAMSLPAETKPGSAGKPAPCFDVAVVDDQDNLLPPGEVGEIVVRPRASNVMFTGYWRQPEATINTWSNLWHHTGDYGRFDSDGFLYYVDRKMDFLRRRGENISSMEVEATIQKHPEIAEAALVAVPSALTEDEVLVCLVLVPGQTMAPQKIFEFFKESIPYFAIPRYVRIMEALPRTDATMRVQKHILQNEGVAADTFDLEALGFRLERDERR